MNCVSSAGVVAYETLKEEGKVKVVDPSMTKFVFTPSLYALVQRSLINMPS